MFSPIATRGVDVHPGQAREVVGLVLRAEPGRLGLELGGVLGLPPVAKHAGPVGLAALVVEAVGDLVADDPADAAVIDRRIGVGIEEGRLEDGGREDDLVLHRRVISVHRLRGHSPLGLVDRLLDPVAAVIPFEAGGALGIADEVAGDDLEAPNSRATCPDSRS